MSRISIILFTSLASLTIADQPFPARLSNRTDPKNCQLKKQHEELKRSLREHLQHRHSSERNNKLATARSSQLLKISSSGDVISLFKSSKYNGQLGPLNSRLAFKPDDSGALPPQPTVKRLKGELAKSVGSKNDGCDWFTFHPDLNTSSVKP